MDGNKEAKLKRRPIFKSKMLKYVTITAIIGLVLIGLALLFTARYDLRAWIDAVSFAAIIIIAFGWMLFITNEGLFDIATYGVSAFFTALLRGKRPKKTFIEYRFDREPLPSAIYKAVWLTGFLYLGVVGVLYIFYTPV